jgi:hypothetical protein
VEGGGRGRLVKSWRHALPFCRRAGGSNPRLPCLPASPGRIALLHRPARSPRAPAGARSTPGTAAPRTARRSPPAPLRGTGPGRRAPGTRPRGMWHCGSRCRRRSRRGCCRPSRCRPTRTRRRAARRGRAATAAAPGLWAGEVCKLGRHAARRGAAPELEALSPTLTRPCRRPLPLPGPPCCRGRTRKVGRAAGELRQVAVPGLAGDAPRAAGLPARRAAVRPGAEHELEAARPARRALLLLARPRRRRAGPGARAQRSGLAAAADARQVARLCGGQAGIDGRSFVGSAAARVPWKVRASSAAARGPSPHPAGPHPIGRPPAGGRALASAPRRPPTCHPPPQIALHSVYSPTAQENDGAAGLPGSASCTAAARATPQTAEGKM